MILEPSKHEKVKIKDLSPGLLFLFNGDICLKTEYFTPSEACQCYVVGTGEMFWGGASSPDELNNIEVFPLYIDYDLEEKE